MATLVIELVRVCSRFGGVIAAGLRENIAAIVERFQSYRRTFCLFAL